MIIGGELVADRLLELSRAAHVGVSRGTVADGGDTGFGCLHRSCEIGLARREADDVAAFRLETCRARGRCHRGGGFDALHAPGKLDRHRDVLRLLRGWGE